MHAQRAGMPVQRVGLATPVVYPLSGIVVRPWCASAQVSHFDKKEVYTAFKQRLKDSEYQDLNTIGTKSA